MKITLTAVLVALLLNVAHAEKVAVDPNTQKAPQAQDAQADQRLDQRITYTATGKRLHTVLAEISAKTGVVINCGKGKDDWRVRDLPVVVCAKDLPLCKLLRGIADCSHLLLTSSQVDGVKHYRIWRDSVREKAIANYLRKVDENINQWTDYEWDTLMKLGSMPEAEIKVDPAEFKRQGGGDFTGVMGFVKVMASLPEDAKQRVFAGERIKVKARDLSPNLAASLRDLFQKAWDEDQGFQTDTHKRLGTPFEPKPASESDLKNAMLTFYVTQGDRQVFRSVLGTTSGFGRDPAINTPAELLGKIIPNWPKPPTPPQMPKYPSAEWMTSLDDARKSGLELTGKIKLKKPEGEREPVFSDLLAAVSDASGYSIICEDFISHQAVGKVDPDLFKGEHVLEDILMSRYPRPDWQVDKDSKLLTGTEQSWCKKHNDLVPESLINHLFGKLNGEGVELDDAASIMGLTSGQYYEWILDSPNIGMVAWAANRREEPFWKFYDSLSASDKEQAKSKDGLLLARFDPWYLSDIFKESSEGAQNDARKSNNPLSEIHSALEGKPQMREKLKNWLLQAHPEIVQSGIEKTDVDPDQLAVELKEAFPELTGTSDIPTDPKDIAKLTLRIQKIDLKPSVRVVEKKNGVETVRFENDKNGIKKHTYRMTIDGPGVSLQMDGPMLSFPVYSNKREAEVWKELKEKERTD